MTTHPVLTTRGQTPVRSSVRRMTGLPESTTERPATGDGPPFAVRSLG